MKDKNNPFGSRNDPASRESDSFNLLIAVLSAVVGAMLLTLSVAQVQSYPFFH